MAKIFTEQKRQIIQFLARNGPSSIKEIKKDAFLVNDPSRPTIHRRLNGHKGSPGLVAQGCVNKITVTDHIRDKFNLEPEVEYLYEVDEENIRDCPHIDEGESRKIAEHGNEIFHEMEDKGVLKSPDTDSIESFLREFTDNPDARFSERKEIEINEEDITDSNGNLTQEALQKFMDLWIPLIARDPDWTVDISIDLKPSAESRKTYGSRPDVMNFLTEDDFLMAIQENKKIPEEDVKE